MLGRDVGKAEAEEGRTNSVWADYLNLGSSNLSKWPVS